MATAAVVIFGLAWFVAFALATMDAGNGGRGDSTEVGKSADSGPEKAGKSAKDDKESNGKMTKTVNTENVSDGGWRPLSGARAGQVVRLRLNGEEACELPNLYRLPHEGGTLEMWDVKSRAWIESRLRLDPGADTYRYVGEGREADVTPQVLDAGCDVTPEAIDGGLGDD